MKKKYVTCTEMMYLVLCVLFSSVLVAQENARDNLTPADYGLWSQLLLREVSDQGNWVSYLLRYETKQDTLFVKNTSTGKKYPYAGYTNGAFLQERSFACLSKDHVLAVTDLQRDTLKKIPDVVSFECTASGGWLLTVEERSNFKKLCLRTPQGALVLEVDDLTSYKLNPQKDAVAYSHFVEGMYVSGMLHLSGTPRLEIYSRSVGRRFEFQWSENGCFVVFYEETEGKDLAVGFYNRTTKKSGMLAVDRHPLFKDHAIYPDVGLPLKITNDGSNVFFRTRFKNFEVAPKTVVELWQGNAPYLFPLQQMADDYNKPYLAFWNTVNNSTDALSSAARSKVLLVGNGTCVLSGDPGQYQPQYCLWPDLDYYLTDLDSGKTTFFGAKLSSHESQIVAAPCGKFVAYYKEGDWWLYDIKRRSHRNLTQGLSTVWDNSDYDPGAETSVYGAAGWSTDGKSILLYDRYDLWQISCDGKVAKRLTEGKERQEVYRLVKQHAGTGSLSHDTDLFNVYDLSKELLLSVVDHSTAASGYKLLDPRGAFTTLAFAEAQISHIVKAKNAAVYVYLHQRYDQPPSLYKKITGTDAQQIVATNAQQCIYFWGKSKLITYCDSKGTTLKGALFYPANYDPSLQYPMVVHLYERQSLQVHQYVNPSLHLGHGFNTTNFTTNGYFVLLPDIVYEVGNPGKSAADCVTNAVGVVLGMGLVAKGKVGLYGHSFGAYETNFILTQTNLFAAAVSGAGVSDTQQHYFTVNSEMNTAEAWRYENQQYRMGYSFYERQDLYLDNSPLVQASAIETPLLLWAGAEDQNVLSTQSIAFFIALKRLQKKVAMLIYPKEGHILVSKNAKEDLNQRVLQWYEHYLKDKPCRWVEASTQ